MREIILIRHGATAGNLERRYIGRTDEPLCETGRKQIEVLKQKIPPVTKVYCSPMLRCRQTAEILFGKTGELVDDLREMDFGAFEGKSYEELKDNPQYKLWTNAFLHTTSGGEDFNEFKERCINAFVKIKESQKDEDIALVTHGGCIMAICQYLYGGELYSYTINNGDFRRV